MSAEANKAIVRAYLEKMRQGDPTLPDLLADDASWWVPPSSPMGGTHQGKDAVLALMGGGVGLYDADVPMQIEIEEMVAEGAWVCVQLILEARTARGEPYRNHYHFAFRIRDGRIHAVREYVDTLYAQRKLFDATDAG